MKSLKNLNIYIFLNQMMLVLFFIGSFFIGIDHIERLLYGFIGTSALMHLLLYSWGEADSPFWAKKRDKIPIENAQKNSYDIKSDELHPANGQYNLQTPGAQEKQITDNREISVYTNPEISLNDTILINTQSNPSKQESIEKLEKEISELKAKLLKKESDLANLEKKNKKLNQLEVIIKNQFSSVEMDSAQLLDSLFSFFTDNHLENSIKSLEEIKSCSLIGNLFIEEVDKLMTTFPTLGKRLEKIKVIDKYRFFINAMPMGYRYWLNLQNWHFNRSKDEKLSQIAIDIELAQITKNIFDAILFSEIDHWNYKIIIGEPFSELKTVGYKENASNYTSLFTEYIKYCRKNKIELEVFMEKNTLCPTWIEIPEEKS